ncbi:MAG: cysteine synthase family protein [Acidobacteriota bacterium]|nr:cysteine synthase family protein [Acidobacteriota bacterium]
MSQRLLAHPDITIRSDDLLSSIGGTPLIRLHRVTRDLRSGVEVCAKAEHLNPGGSVKDRAARAMILEGERSGQLHSGKIILDATSGNTGIAYAMIGAARGYRVKLCLPKNASFERKRVLHIYGAEMIETDPAQGTDGAQLRASEMVAGEPEKYFYPDQYNNDANWRAHYEGTAPEIWEQTTGRITHFITGLGTSGTFMGIVRRLKEYDAKVRVVSVQPNSPFHGLEGMKHMASSRVPGIYDPTLANENVWVSTEEAQEMARRLAREEGLFVGVSSGANVLAALRLARSLPAESLVVTILCDDGGRYLSDDLWKDANKDNFSRSKK